MLGISLSADNGVLSMIQAESGGNPNAINLTDSNARAGHPSQGLMQTIPGTFARWRNPGLPNNILDPLANIYAGVNYALHTYGAGMLMAGGNHGPGGKYIGYKDGTNYVPTDQFALLHKGEAVVPASRNQGAPFQGGGPVTLQLDGPATKALLQGHAVEVVADGFATLRSRMITNPS
jgi:SLT domain-containing protein